MDGVVDRRGRVDVWWMGDAREVKGGNRYHYDRVGRKWACLEANYAAAIRVVGTVAIFWFAK